MANSNFNLENKIENQSLKVKPSKRRPSRSYRTAAFGFTVTKVKNRYVAICKVCNRALGNTAFARLKTHRNKCKLPTVVHPQLSSTQSYDSMSNFPASNDYENFNTGEVPQYMSGDKQVDENIVEVLKIIKENKHTLFNKSSVSISKGWIEVLEKAKSFGLAPENSHWKYARDGLFEVWKYRTLKKRNSMTIDEWENKMNIVDFELSQILEESEPISEESNLNLTNNLGDFQCKENSSFVNEFPTISTTQSTTTVSTQTSDQIHEAELRLKLLQCEALEIENYKQSLHLLKLERRLKLSPSKFTLKFFQRTSNAMETCNESQEHYFYDSIVKNENTDEHNFL